MEENKILKVLEGLSSGTKLYSVAFGNLEFECVVKAFGDKRIKLIEDNRDRVVYFPNGRYRKDGEVTLYPSREMRDWDKFAWKKGDVLRRESDKTMVLFEKFTDDTYTMFFGKYFCKEASITSAERKVLKTEDYSTSTRLTKEYIYTIETTFGGKLNLKTLKVIEDIKPKPKKENATYKKVSDKPEHEFQPFEKVLVRDLEDEAWHPNLYGYKDSDVSEEYAFVCVSSHWKYCIPYKGNEHLLGTTNNPE